EAQQSGQECLKTFAVANNVIEGIEVRGLCTAELLNEVLRNAERTVVICDVEGAELEILDPTIAPRLLLADVLVELHPWADESMDSRIAKRFAGTHTIQKIATRCRTASDFPQLVSFSDDEAAACMDETRPCPMSWLWMTARGHAGQ